MWFLRTLKSLLRLKTHSTIALGPLLWSREGARHDHIFRTSANSTLVSVSKHIFIYQNDLIFFCYSFVRIGCCLDRSRFFSVVIIIIVVVVDAVSHSFSYLLLMNSYTYWNELTIAYGQNEFAVFECDVCFFSLSFFFSFRIIVSCLFLHRIYLCLYFSLSFNFYHGITFECAQPHFVFFSHESIINMLPILFVFLCLAPLLMFVVRLYIFFQFVDLNFTLIWRDAEQILYFFLSTLSSLAMVICAVKRVFFNQCA